MHYECGLKRKKFNRECLSRAGAKAALKDLQKTDPTKAASLRQKAENGDWAPLDRQIAVMTSGTKFSRRDGYDMYSQRQWENKMLECGASVKEATKLWNRSQDRMGHKYEKI